MQSDALNKPNELNKLNELRKEDNNG